MVIKVTNKREIEKAVKAFINGVFIKYRCADMIVIIEYTEKGKYLGEELRLVDQKYWYGYDKWICDVDTRDQTYFFDSEGYVIDRKDVEEKAINYIYNNFIEHLKRKMIR